MNCLFCEHFYFSAGYERLSELTAGKDTEIYCSKGYWDAMDNSESMYRLNMLSARTCKDYNPVHKGGDT